MLNNHSALDVEDYYRESLAAQRHSVLYNDYVDGINRTDFKVFFKKKNLPADLCSTGEQKALLISIILAQTKCHIIAKGFAPILLLDEVTTHLDNEKRDALLEKISALRLQAWITSTEVANFKVLENRATFLKIHEGTLI
ncbi:MAG: hypothetical protein J6039_03530 [Alphaproteobacteria bacterium]|nr:hypothetical protein [Alphaproteobacteria bacterium]